MATAVIGQLVDGRKIAKETAAGPGAAAASVEVEFPDLRVIGKVVYAGITGGYYLDDDALVVAGNKVTVTPKYFAYSTSVDGAAIPVPLATDLSGETITLIAIGY